LGPFLIEIRPDHSPKFILSDPSYHFFKQKKNLSHVFYLQELSTTIVSQLYLVKKQLSLTKTGL